VFGSPSSTSGHLMPRHFLMQQGIDPDRDFPRIAFSGAHDATAAFVAAGRAHAGALNSSVWEKLVETRNPGAAKLRVLATTPPYFDYNWTVRAGLDPALVRTLTGAFLRLDPANPEHRDILALQRASRFVPTQASNYEDIERAAQSAGLLQ
jgi:phosphonate transport system substrate-binding protein